MSNIPYFKEQRDSEIRGIATCCYSLVDIASYLSIDVESTISDIQQEYQYLNDYFAKRCMEAIIQRERLPFYVEANCEVNKMRDLPELCSSSAERSDIIVYTDSEKKKSSTNRRNKILNNVNDREESKYWGSKPASPATLL